MAGVNYFSMWSVIFILVTGDVNALQENANAQDGGVNAQEGDVNAMEVDIHFVDRVVQMRVPSKEETPNQYQFCGRSSEEELSQTCEELSRHPKLADIGTFNFYRWQAPGLPQTYSFVRSSIFRRNTRATACQCQTEPAIYVEYSPPESNKVAAYLLKRPQNKVCCTPQCCSKSFKVICAPCICIGLTLAAIDYGLGRCIVGEDYANVPWPCCVDES